MTVRHWIVVAAVVAMAVPATLPAHAQSEVPDQPFDSLSAQALLKGVIRDDDVTLLFEHLRESMAAAARGEEARPSEALKRRAGQIQRDLSVRGTALMGALLSTLEAETRRALRDALREPAPHSPHGL